MIGVLKNQIKPAEQSVVLRKMKVEDMMTAAKWINADEWNMCDNDFDVLHACYPETLEALDLNGEMISSICSIKYQSYTYITLFLTKPEFRGSGLARKLIERWHHLALGPEFEALTLDVEPHMIPVFKKVLFKEFCSNNRYIKKAEGRMTKNLFDLKTVPFEMVAQYDLEVFGYDRSKYLQALINRKGTFGLGMIKEGKLLGYGLLRKSTVGWSINPLFAQNQEVANEIQEGLQSLIAGQTVHIEVLGVNKQAVELVEKSGWEVQLRHVRLMRKGIPKTDFSRTFGVGEFS